MKLRPKDSALKIIKLQGLSLHIDETRSGCLCPFCRGGRTKERTMSITREGGRIKYICHRDSCGRKGIVLVGGPSVKIDPSTTSPTKIEDKPKFRPVSRPPGQEDLRWLATCFGLDAKTVARSGFEMLEKPNIAGGRSLLVPLRALDGHETGWEVRDYAKTSRHKKSTRTTRLRASDPIQSWHVPRRQTWEQVPPYVFVVEDNLSAARISQAFPALSLCGTHMHPHHLKSIRDIHKVVGFGRGLEPRTYLALDKDAYDTALKQRDKYHGLMGQTVVVKLDKDIKDLPEQDFWELFQDLGV